MHLQRTGVGHRPSPRRLSRRTCCAIASLTAILAAIGLGPAVAPAGATTPEKTDIMFVFDTSGSMSGVLTEAKEEIKTLITDTQASLPNAEFGVANVEDLPGYIDGKLGLVFNKKGEEVPQLTEQEYEEDTEKPWALWQPLTSETPKIEEAIDNLSGEEVAHGGGDLPEAEGRALYETATNSRIGWRPGARHEIVLITDNVPHTPNVNEGIPPEFQFTEPGNDGFETWPNTGEELEGKWGIPGTQWKEGESLEFHKTLQKLAAEEKPLAMVDYFHTGEEEKSNYIHYWEYWAAATGGQAIVANEGAKELDTKLAEIIKESAEGIPPCPPGYERTATTPCVKKPTPAPTPTPTPTKPAPIATPPTPKTIVVDEEDGEIEDEFEFDESGSGELSGEVDDGAEAARFHGVQDLQAGSLTVPLTAGLAQSRTEPVAVAESEPAAVVAKKGKGKKCKKGYVKKGKKCVNNAPIKYGYTVFTIPAAGKYRFKIKPTGKALAALKKGKSLNVKVELVFTPAGTTTHILSTQFVRVHLKPKKHRKHHKK